MSNTLYITRTCVDCGKVMRNVYHTKVRCPECGHQHHLDMCAAYRERKRAERMLHPAPKPAPKPIPKKPVPAVPVTTLADDIRAADKLGISYGKYMLLKMQANKKACPCANTDKPKR